MLPILALVLLSPFYVAWRIAPALPGPWAGGVFASAMLLVPLMVLAWRHGHARRSRAVADRWNGIGMLVLGSFSILLVLTLLREPLLALAWAFGLPGMAAASALGVLLLGVLGTAFGWRSAHSARVKEVEVPIAGLPAALQGFTIVQLSDMHVGPSTKRPFVQRIVDATNRLQADAIAITGDLVDGRVRDLLADVAPLADLRSRHGTFFVTGNHEYYSGADEWVAWLGKLGLRVLSNEHVVLQHDGSRLVMAGVTDYGSGHFDAAQPSDPARALRGAPADTDLRVLLAHQPRSASAAADAGFDVQLSGHTHGGQIWPFHYLVTLQQPFVAGLRRLRQLWVYTSRGTGYWGPPLRLGAPSEITRLRFVAA